MPSGSPAWPGIPSSLWGSGGSTVRLRLMSPQSRSGELSGMQ
jgi:hypothetical protein